MLLELGKQNPQVLRLINENQAEFFRLINEPGAGGVEGYFYKSLAACSIYLTFHLHVVSFIVHVEEAIIFYNLLLILFRPICLFVCLQESAWASW